MYPKKRYNRTLKFFKKHISLEESILDLGIDNPFSKILRENGYTVENTKGEDLDEDLTSLTNSNANVISALEILEHLLSPYVLLKTIKAEYLIASVPLKLWFSNAYRSTTDQRDRHYHEFEEWQFNWLLEKTGWKIISKEKWTNPSKKIGFRPILRNFYPRYYIVFAKKIN
tara:strand:+ start:2109 stop:2621 length:513 start_codon:yes stop_codon:yes gene_type:complete